MLFLDLDRNSDALASPGVGAVERPAGIQLEPVYPEALARMEWPCDCFEYC